MKVLVLTTGWPSEERPAAGIFVAAQVERLREVGVSVEIMPFEGHARLRNYLRARREARRKISAQEFDLVHAHFGQTVLALPSGSPPLVLTLHGSDLIGIVGRSGSYVPKGLLLKQVTRYATRRAGHTILPSSTLARYLPRGVPYSVIPVGVDLDVFRNLPKREARRGLGLPMTPKLVLFSGQPSSPVKRFELAVEAVDRLRDRFEVELVTIQDRPPHEVAMYMSACDVLLVTARHEAGPVMALEALACDLPVVGLDVGGVREWVGDLPGCEVCDDDAPATISAALLRVLASPVPFEGRDRARLLDSRLMARRVLDVYERVARKAG